MIGPQHADDEAAFWSVRQSPDQPDHRTRMRAASPQQLWEDPRVEAIARGPFLDRMLRACSPPGLEILELACGCGWLSLELARAGHSVRGIDLSPGRIQSAREYAERLRRGGEALGPLEHEVGDLNSLRLQEERYDRIVCWDGLHHIASLAPLLVQVRRALRPGGRLVLFDHIGPANRLQERMDQAIACAVLLACQPASLWRLLRGERGDPRAPSEGASGFEMVRISIEVFGGENVVWDTALASGKRWLARLRGPEAMRLGLIRGFCALDRWLIARGLARGEYVYLEATRPAASDSERGF